MQAAVREQEPVCLHTAESPAHNLHTVGTQQIPPKWKIEVDSFVWFSVLFDF